MALLVRCFPLQVHPIKRPGWLAPAIIATSRISLSAPARRPRLRPPRALRPAPPPTLSTPPLYQRRAARPRSGSPRRGYCCSAGWLRFLSCAAARESTQPPVLAGAFSCPDLACVHPYLHGRPGSVQGSPILDGEVRPPSERPSVPWDRLILRESNAAAFLKMPASTFRKKAAAGECEPPLDRRYSHLLRLRPARLVSLPLTARDSHPTRRGDTPLDNLASIRALRAGQSA